MSEGQVFLSNSTPNLTVRIHGKAFEFKNGRYPDRGEETDPGRIATLKQHCDYGKAFISKEDQEARQAKEAEIRNSPKAEAEMVARAMKALEGIPGVRPSELTVSPPQEVKLPESETPVKSQGQSLEQSELVPSLTAVSRMKKIPLLELASKIGMEGLQETDTVLILRRKVKSWIKQNA